MSNIPWYIEVLRQGVNLGEEIMKKEGGTGMPEIKPCPFCGETPKVYGRKTKDYVDGVWAELEGEEYWVKPQCLPMCFLGNTHSISFGFVDGIKYNTPEAAIKVWNKRRKNDTKSA